MQEFLTILAIALLPAAGNAVGGLLAENVRTPAWLIGAALHAAAGIAIAVVSVNLMPRIVGGLSPWLLALAFLAGAAFSAILAAGIAKLRSRFGSARRASSGAWMVYTAVAADLFSDGLMSGAGSAMSSWLGLVLGVSQLVANVPGGFATGASFRDNGMPRWQRVALAFSFALPVLLSASFGFWLLRGTGAAIQNAALAFIVGVLLLATVEDTLPQGDKPQPPRWTSTIAFAGGFSLLALTSLLLQP